MDTCVGTVQPPAATMSAPPTQPQWIWSQSLRAYYYHDTQRNLYVTQDGRQVPAPNAATPRGIPVPNANERRAPPPPNTSRDRASSYASTGSGPQYQLYSGGPSGILSTSPPSTRAIPSANINVTNSSPSRHDQSLAAAMGGLSLQGGTQSVPPSDPTIRRGYNQQQDIRTIVKIAPSIDITQPELQNTAVRAHAQVLPTQGQQETLNPGTYIHNLLHNVIQWLTLLRIPSTHLSFKVLCIWQSQYEIELFRPCNKLMVQVFLVLWAEPAGAGTTITTLPIVGRFQEPVFTKVRRFVVIRAGDRSCSALYVQHSSRSRMETDLARPIMTYERQGPRKKNINISEHGIVHTGKQPEPSAVQLPGMQPKPIRINTDDPTDKLDPLSLIHYGKVYTVEHNVKVKPYGNVHEKYLSALTEQFSSVWLSGVGTHRNAPGHAAGAPVQVYRAGAASSSSASKGQSVPNAPLPVNTASLTTRQLSAMREHGDAAEQRARMVQQGAASDRRSVRSSTAGSETDVSVGDPQQRARRLYETYTAAFERKGYSSADARKLAIQQMTDIASTQCAEGSNTTSRAAEVRNAQPPAPVSAQPVAIPEETIRAVQEARGVSRHEALRLIHLRMRQAQQGQQRGQGKGKGKEKEREQ